MPWMQRKQRTLRKRGRTGKKSKANKKSKKTMTRRGKGRHWKGGNSNSVEQKLVVVPGMGTMTENEYKNKMNSLNPIGFDD